MTVKNRFDRSKQDDEISSSAAGGPALAQQVPSLQKVQKGGDDLCRKKWKTGH